MKMASLKISQNSQEKTYVSQCLWKTLAQVFSCKFYEIFKNIFVTEQFWITMVRRSLKNVHQIYLSCYSVCLVIMF